jgi:ribonuclease E
MTQIAEMPPELEGKDIVMQNGKWVLKPEQTPPKTEAKTEAPKTEKKTKPVKAEKPKVEPKPTNDLAPTTSAPKSAKGPKTDPQTDETADEIVERAETEIKHKAHAKAAQLFKRAANLVDDEPKKLKLLERAAKEDDLAKAKGQKEQPVSTEKKEEKKAAAKPAEKKAAKPVAKAKPKAEAKSNGHAKKVAASASKSNGQGNGTSNGHVKVFKTGEGNADNHGYPRTPSELKAAHERTLAAVAGMRKKDELSDDEKEFMKQIARGPKTLRQIGDAGWPRMNSFDRYLKAKNAKRTPVAQKLCKRVKFEQEGKKVNGYERA